MKLLKCLTLVGVVFWMAAICQTADASEFRTRQYYSGWQRNTRTNYYYRQLYYKPSPSYVGYRHHYVVYFPQRPKYYYFYNPYKKVFWGRCPVDTAGEGAYSMLAEADRKADIKDIPESAFPKPAAMPALPESTDDEKLDLPPDDLPPVDGSLPKTTE